MLSSDDLRAVYLDFFARRGHKIVASDSLVPAADPSLLFTGAGMNQFKDQFLGRRIEYRRAASCQKCLRTGDIENVGRTASHHTFFEMLGNFSFGDYFKKETIEWAWEFVTEHMKLPIERLLVSVYRDDDEAFEIWRRSLGLPAERIYRFDEHSNFWPADAPAKGPNGPCGPCSEIFYDQGAGVGCGRPDCGPDCDCGRFVEIWNLVFTQFDRQDGGVLVPLPQKNVDTGMGLERAARVMQNKTTNFEIDILAPLVLQAAAIAGVRYGQRDETDRRLRRIADHVRAVTFAVNDGALPSNEGRGYVVRRLLRRAELDADRLGVDQPFLYQMVPTVVKLMGVAYPDLSQRLESIAALVRNEEERFRRTLRRGVELLEQTLAELPEGAVFSGQQAFELYDTYGFPLELTADFLKERGIRLDAAGFESAADEQRQVARAGAAFGDIFPAGPLEHLKAEFRATEFVGYATTSADGEVLAIVSGAGRVHELAAGVEGIALFSRTTFYAEAGGQVADAGSVRAGQLAAEVRDVQKTGELVLHRLAVTSGVLKVGMKVTLTVDAARRLAIARNHTATHLLHKALRNLLGAHVQQAGSLVTPERLRLDFTHFRALEAVELEQLEQLVNGWIMQDLPVSTMRLPLDEAKKRGAIALFGEKYSDTVRMVQVADVSAELCGGTHLDSTGKLGAFLVRREEAVSAGIRRIEALSGEGALNEIRAARRTLGRLAAVLKSPAEELPARIEALQARARELERELRAARARSAAGRPESREEIAGVIFIHQHLEAADASDLNAAADRIRATLAGQHVLALSSAAAGKALLTVWVEKSLAGKVSANSLIQAAANHIQGSGGGRPERAQAGGKDPSGLPAAIEAIRRALRTAPVH